MDNERKTLEDAALEAYPPNIVKLTPTVEYDADALKRKAFIEGATWQMEHIIDYDKLAEYLVKHLERSK